MPRQKPKAHLETQGALPTTPVRATRTPIFRRRGEGEGRADTDTSYASDVAQHWPYFNGWPFLSNRRNTTGRSNRHPQRRGYTSMRERKRTPPFPGNTHAHVACTRRMHSSRLLRCVPYWQRTRSPRANHINSMTPQAAKSKGHAVRPRLVSKTTPPWVERPVLSSPKVLLHVRVELRIVEPPIRKRLLHRKVSLVIRRTGFRLVVSSRTDNIRGGMRGGGERGGGACV